MLAESKHHAEAAEVMTQALEQAPAWAAGWFQLADYAEKSGGRKAAIAALSTVLRLDPADIFGAGLKLALLGATSPPAVPPAGYVERLFDDYAARFDTALVERLAYTVPEKLAALILDHAGATAHFPVVTDLGCGTGLFGQRIRSHAGTLEGFDLSTNMLAQAAEKAVYDRLAKADLSRPAAESGLFGPGVPEGRCDLATAADVLIYLGDLHDIFPSVARLLRPGGLFAFSLEDGGEASGPVLRPSLRYAHPAAFIRQLAAENGFAILACRCEVIRMDAGAPVSGLLFLARHGEDVLSAACAA